MGIVWLREVYLSRGVIDMPDQSVFVIGLLFFAVLLVIAGEWLTWWADQ